MRVLAKQLYNIPQAVATVDDLRDQGKWADLYQINAAIDTAFAAATFEGNDAATAERVQDQLALHMCVRELPPNRPTALRLLQIPGATPGSCLACADPACKGNRVDDLGDGSFRVVFEHHKTRTRIQEAIRIPVAANTVTAVLLHDYVQRRRPLLVKTDTRALFLNKRGDAFSEYSFGEYVPRLLNQLGLGSLSYTTVSALRGRRRPPPAPHSPLW